MPQSVESSDSYSVLLESHAEFLEDLKCIEELQRNVLQVLSARDTERTSRVKQLSLELPKRKGKPIDLSFVETIQEMTDHVKQIRRAERMFRQALVTSAIAKFDHFLASVLTVAFHCNPDWLKSLDKKISYRDLLCVESLESFKAEIISREINSLMRDSHFEQLQFIDDKLQLGIEASFAGWRDFLELAECRNLFVHTGGAISDIYVANCRKLGIAADPKLKLGMYLSAPTAYISSALDTLYELATRVTQGSARRLFKERLADLDGELNSEGIELLRKERWSLAERIFDYAGNIPTKLQGSGESQYLFLVNLCIALKFQGKPFKDRLHRIDWEPFHPKFHLAVAVLEDRFDDATKLMRSPAVLDGVAEHDFKTWPLFHAFRKTADFESAFRDVFHKNLADELLQDAENAMTETVPPADEVIAVSQISTGTEVTVLP